MDNNSSRDKPTFHELCYMRNESAEISEIAGSYNWFNFVINGPITMSTVILGVICNTISVIIFLQPKKLLCIYYYLITLVMWDTALLLMASLLYSFPTLHYGHLPNFGPYIQTYRFWFTGSNICLIGSVWVMLILTVDRYFALCHPLRHQAVVTRARLMKVLILMSSLVILYGLPRFFELTVGFCLGPSGQLEPLILPSTLRSNSIYLMGYKIGGSLLFYSALPFILLLMLTVRISLELQRSRSLRRKMRTNATIPLKKTSSRQNVDSANVMLLAVAGKFLVSRLIPTLLDVAEAVVGEEQFAKQVVANYAVDISNYIVVLNSVTNSWIFFAFGKTFRQEFFALFRNTKYQAIPKTCGGESRSVTPLPLRSSQNSENEMTYRSYPKTTDSSDVLQKNETAVELACRRLVKLNNDHFSVTLEMNSIETVV